MTTKEEETITFNDLPSTQAVLWWPWGNMNQYWTADQLNHLLGLIGEAEIKRRFCRVYDSRDNFVGVMQK